jgi:hypothetical protein
MMIDRRVLAIVVGFLGCSSPTPSPSPAPEPAPAPARGELVATTGALTARVVEGQCQGLGPGTTVQAGGTLQTAPTERAKIALSDGSFVILDSETRLVLEPAPRQVRLESGQGVFEVVQIPGGPPLRVKLLRTEGQVEVLGTKLRIREDGGRALVDVSRGSVQLSCPRGVGKVLAGQQGIMVAGSPPEIVAAPDLGQAIGWSQASGVDAEAGIGSLRARRVQLRSAPESELRLANHAVKVRISGPVARTEIEQRFSNDTDFELEGTYRFPLPAGARIAAMALEVDGQFREGRFVDRSTGERIWRGVQKNARLGGRLGRVNTDDILFAAGPWRDPALLAWEAGNRFSIRIFPIHPHSTRTVRLAYVETLSPTAGGRRYVYPLPQGQWGSIGRSVADRMDVDVRVSGHDATKPVRIAGLTLNATDEADARKLAATFDRFVPSGNLVVEIPETTSGAIRSATFRDGAELFSVVALRPSLPLAQTPVALENVVVLDSSYSAVGEMWRRQVAVAESLVREMGADDRVTVLTCDVGCRPVGAPSQIPSIELATAMSDALARVEPGGTSDIARAIEEASRMVSSAGGGASRTANIVYVGDGVATVGVRDPGRVAELAARAASSARAFVSTIAVGTSCDERMLGELARRTGGVAIGYAPGDEPTALALRMLGRLRGPTLVGATVELPPGAFEVAPATMPAIHAGEEVWIAARFAGPTNGDVVLRGSVDGRPFETRARVNVADDGSPGNVFVPQMWAEKRALDLAAAGDMNREQIVALGTRYGLVTPFTSLLVLDSDALAERLGLGPRTTSPQWTGTEEAELAEAQGQSAGPTETLAAPAPSSPAPGPRSATTETAEPRRPQRARDPEMSAREEAPADGLRAGRRGPAEASGAVAQTAPAPRPPSPPPAATPPVIRDPGVGSPRPGGGGFGDADRNAAGAGAPAPVVVVQGGVAVQPDGTMVAQPPHGPGRPGWWGGVRPRIPVRVAAIRNVRVGAQGLLGATQDVLEEVADAKAALGAEPDRRRNHRDLARLLGRIGEVSEGTSVLRGWLARDALDAEALGMLGEMLARGGDRDRAIRTLSSVVEVQPGDKASHDRMAKLYERAARFEDACAHRVTLAALSPEDETAAAAATRCQTTNEPPAAESIAGNLVVGLRTESGVDLDVAVLFRDGTRVSWMGGRRGVRAAEATSLQGERLAIGFLPVGTYTVEVTRTSAPGASSPVGTGSAPVVTLSGPPISGTIELRALGERRTVPFRLDGARAAVAVVTVRTELR